MDMTVREIDAYAAGVDRRARSDMAMALWAAWQTANYTRAKRLPDIRGKMREIMRGKGGQSREEVRSVIEHMRMAAKKQGLGPPSALLRAQAERAGQDKQG